MIPRTNFARIGKTAILALALSATARSHADVTFGIDLSGPQTAISPLIYGLNDWARDATTESTGFTLERMGGNRTTSYNWENNFSNAGSDYLQHSDNLLVSGQSIEDQSKPGWAVRTSVDHARSGNRPSLVTLQLAGYVAADGNGTVSEADTAPSDRWKTVKITKGSALSLTPDTSDNEVYLDEQVNFLIQTYGTAAEGGILAYSMDNEPTLWSHTHPRIHPDQPSVAEIIDQNAECAAMVKNLDPSALVFGPALYGWNAYANFQNASDWPSYNGTYDWLISAYLDQMRQRSTTAGTRLLDALDIHYYPEASAVTGTDGSGNDVYTRITDSSNTHEALTQARLQAPRSLWDTTYTENSWVAQWGTFGPIQLLPRIFSSIDNYYPETGISISEYDFGGHQNYSGGLAQADVLGIYGRDGVDAACYWGEMSGFVIPAFQLYRNYDGNGASFGDLNVSSVNPDAENYSSYVAINRSTNAVHVILINKTDTAQDATLDFGDDSLKFSSIHGYGFSEAGGAKLVDLGTVGGPITNPPIVALPAHAAVHYILSGPELSPGKTQVSRNEAGTKIPILFRTELGQNYKLRQSTNLIDWDDTGTTIAGDGQVHLTEQSIDGTHMFWRYEKID